MTASPRPRCPAVDAELDEVLELLEELEGGGNRSQGLVVEHPPVSSPRGADGARLRRFGFGSALAWWSLRRYGLLPSEKPAASAQLAEALLEVYGESHTLAVRPLARLFETAGESTARATFVVSPTTRSRAMS